MKAIQRWQWVLILSLGLNMFLGSAMAVYLTRLPYQMMPPPPPPGGPMQDFIRRLPPEDSAILAAIWQARGEARFGPQEMFAAMAGLDAAIAAEPFDPERFDAAIRAFQSLRAAEDQAIAETLREALPRLSTEGRQVLARHPHGPPPS